VTSTIAPHAAEETRKNSKVAESDRTVAENRLGQRLVAPAVIMMVLVTAWPMLQALYHSLF
jgi:multiple sugar transport system permease protein